MRVLSLFVSKVMTVRLREAQSLINMCGNTVVILHASDHTVIESDFTLFAIYFVEGEQFSLPVLLASPFCAPDFYLRYEI